MIFTASCKTGRGGARGRGTRNDRVGGDRTDGIEIGT